MTRSAPSRCTAPTVCGAASAWACSPTAPTATAGITSSHTVRGRLFYGDASQFVAQLIGAATCFVFIFVRVLLFFKMMDKTVGMRVSPEAELMGIDIPGSGRAGLPARRSLSIPDIPRRRMTNGKNGKLREKVRSV